jgi:hypothetical protein
VPHPVFLETLRISHSDESSLILLPSQLDPSKVVTISTFVVNDTAVRCQPFNSAFDTDYLEPLLTLMSLVGAPCEEVAYEEFEVMLELLQRLLHSATRKNKPPKGERENGK